MARLKKIKIGRIGLSSLMANIIMVGITIAIVIAASLWSGGLINIFTRYDRIEIKNSYMVNRAGKLVMIIKYMNVGMGVTRVDSVLLNGVPYTSYTPIPKLGGDLSSLPSVCEIGVSKEGTITFEPGATDPSGNKLTIGVSLIVTITTSHGQGSVSMSVPSTENDSSKKQEGSGGGTTTPLAWAYLTVRSPPVKPRFGPVITDIATYPNGNDPDALFNLVTSYGFSAIAIQLDFPPSHWYNWRKNRDYIVHIAQLCDASNGRIVFYIITSAPNGINDPEFCGALDDLLLHLGPAENHPGVRMIANRGEYTKYYFSSYPGLANFYLNDWLPAGSRIMRWGYKWGTWGGTGGQNTVPACTIDQFYGLGLLARTTMTGKINDNLTKLYSQQYVAYTDVAHYPSEIVANHGQWMTQWVNWNQAPFNNTPEKMGTLMRAFADAFAVNGQMEAFTFYILPECFTNADNQFISTVTKSAKAYGYQFFGDMPPVETIPVSPHQSPDEIGLIFPPYPTGVELTGIPYYEPDNRRYVVPNSTFDWSCHAGELTGRLSMEGQMIELYWTSLLTGETKYAGSTVINSQGWGYGTSVAPPDVGWYYYVMRFTGTDTLKPCESSREMVLVDNGPRNTGYPYYEILPIKKDFPVGDWANASAALIVIPAQTSSPKQVKVIVGYLPNVKLAGKLLDSSGNVLITLDFPTTDGTGIASEELDISALKQGAYIVEVWRV